VNYPILKSELTTDPLIRGYAGMTDAQVADALNTPNRQMNVESVTGQQVFECILLAEYNALTVDQKSLLHAIIGMGTISVNGTNTKAALLAMFGPGTITRTNLAILQKRTVNRVEELGLGSVETGHVASARSM